MFTDIVYWLFLLAIAAQCGYALYFFRRIFFMPAAKQLPVTERQPVSIIICAKNEARNLQKNLPAILSQQYHNAAGKPMFEVIVVNDNSTDNTASIMQEMERQYDNLWDVLITDTVERDLQGKKFALSYGVVYAKNDWLLLTDADCAPTSDHWLEQMVTPLAAGKEIVAGYGGYNKTWGLLNAFIRWETLHTFLQYSTYSLAGKPYMAVGRNLACTKNILLRAQKSDVWNALPSGDDDLLVSIAGNATNTAVVCHPSSFTYSDAKATWAEWIAQKQRHMSTGKYYSSDLKMLLADYAGSHAVVWIGFFILLSYAKWKIVAALFIARCIIYWILWIVTAVRLREKNLIYFFPFFDIGWMVYNFAFLPYITWKNKQQWT